MACFIVPGVEAVVTTVITKRLEAKEKKLQAENVHSDNLSIETPAKRPFSRKLKWLNYMLWGGCALLLFEHIWTGEVVPWFPFLTGALTPEDASAMFGEMATRGVAMAVLITAVWAGMVLVSSILEKNPHKEACGTADSDK